MSNDNISILTFQRCDDSDHNFVQMGPTTAMCKKCGLWIEEPPDYVILEPKEIEDKRKINKKL